MAVETDTITKYKMFFKEIITLFFFHVSILIVNMLPKKLQNCLILVRLHFYYIVNVSCLHLITTVLDNTFVLNHTVNHKLLKVYEFN